MSSSLAKSSSPAVFEFVDADVDERRGPDEALLLLQRLRAGLLFAVALAVVELRRARRWTRLDEGDDWGSTTRPPEPLWDEAGDDVPVLQPPAVV